MASVEITSIQEIRKVSSASTWDRPWVAYALATGIYLVASGLTRPIFLSDTMYYLTTASPGVSGFWDFGHLLWRPFLWLLLRHVDGAPPDRLLHVFHMVDFLSTLAGLAAVWFTVATLRLFTHRVVATTLSATLLSFSHVVQTYSKGGCAYIFAFLFLSIAFYTLIDAAITEPPSWIGAVISGVSLCLAVCLWFPYILALAGTLLAPVFLLEHPRRPWRLVFSVGLISAVLGFMAYGAVASHLGIRSLKDFIAWAETSSHGITISGAKRAVFGLARSFISLGENDAYAVTVKRFVLHDPYNPVHIFRSLGPPLWKLVLFYSFLGSILVSLPRATCGNRMFLLLLTTAFPVLGFAILWQGADLERYLPLFPALMLAIGLSLSTLPYRSATSAIVGLFLVTLVITNSFSLSINLRQRQLQQLSATVHSLNEVLPAESLVLLPPMHPLQRIYWDFPEALPLAEKHLQLERLVDLNTHDTPTWRQRVCRKIAQSWNKQIPVVMESSLLQRSPAPDSAWVEGDDPRVRWKDISGFTSKLEVGDRVGDSDFFWIPATSANVESLSNCR